MSCGPVYLVGPYRTQRHCHSQDLEGLRNVRRVEGDLTVIFSQGINNFFGFDNLSYVGGHFQIGFNNQLSSLQGLSGLRQVNGGMAILTNLGLNNTNGLSNLVLVNGDFRVTGNSKLRKCCSIYDFLTTPGAVTGNIEIGNNFIRCNTIEEMPSICFDVNIERLSSCIGADNGVFQVTMYGLRTLPVYYKWTRQEDNVMETGISWEDYFLIKNLAVGTYNLEFWTDTNDTISQNNLSIAPNNGSAFEISKITTTPSRNQLSNGSVLLEHTGGTAPYAIEWSGTSSGNQSNILVESATISTLINGEYEITVSDNTGLNRSVTVTILDDSSSDFLCTTPLNIVILNDVSSSVDAIEYSQSKQFFTDFLEAVNIGTDSESSRAAIIEWADSNSQHTSIPMTGDMASLLAYRDHTRAYNGGTRLHEAMIMGRNYLKTVGRPGVKPVIVISTDGDRTQINPSLVALADQLKSEGYHIITIALGTAYSSLYIRELLGKMASSESDAPGAWSYSELNTGVAVNMVNQYLCPIDPGDIASVYFERDGAIKILEFAPSVPCANASISIAKFSVEALGELALPAGTPITFYSNDPNSFGAVPFYQYIISCAIPAGSIETFTLFIRYASPSVVYAVLNDDGAMSPPISFPITDIDETIWSNNIDFVSLCVEDIATLVANKYTTTPIPICDSIVLYTIEVCNISEIDAYNVEIIDSPPPDFSLSHTSINLNSCASTNEVNYDIPAGCCVNINLRYNVTGAEQKLYADQDVILDGPYDQTYIHFDGYSTIAENVLLSDSTDCPNTELLFTKEVDTTQMCEGAFLSYTFTIENPLNSPIQNVLFTDILPAQSSWVYRPYFVSGMSLNAIELSGNVASFSIAEIEPNTIAQFSIDVFTGAWDSDGTLTNQATLSNVPDFVNGGVLSINSNSVQTNILSIPKINLPDTIYIDVSQDTIHLAAILSKPAEKTNWTSAGDGAFDNSESLEITYTFGDEEKNKGQVDLFLSLTSECDETGKSIVVKFTSCQLDVEYSIGECDDQGRMTDSSDDGSIFDFIVASENTGQPSSYTISDGSDIYGPFDYGVLNDIVFPADGEEHQLIFSDSLNQYCQDTINVSQNPCSNDCQFHLDFELIESCDDNNTPFDPTDDFFVYNFTLIDLSSNINNTFNLNDGINDYGPFLYGEEQSISLPANGSAYTLQFTDANNGSCIDSTQVTSESCSTAESKEQKIYIPNVFSPNGDGINDYFQIFPGNEIALIKSIAIYNCWGSKVYSQIPSSQNQSNPSINGWDGTFKDQTLDLGVYIYKIDYEDIFGNVGYVRGDVTLVR